MKYILLSPVKLKVVLTPEDLANLSISYIAIDYADQDTRQALIRLLEKGKEETGFNPKRSKLYIEVFPCEDGGMVVYFTSLQPGQLPRLTTGKTPVPVIFAFDDVDTLTTACVQTHQRYSHRIYKSSLHRLGAGYRLIVYPLDYADRLSVLFLSEFAQLLGEGEIHVAFVEEHGQEIIADNALDTLAKYFG